MKLIIPQDLFVFYSAPYDPNRPWAKQNYERDFEENIRYSYTKIFHLYEESWYWFDTKKCIKHYTTCLRRVCKSEQECQKWISWYKNYYLNHPELIYEGRWIHHDLH